VPTILAGFYSLSSERKKQTKRINFIVLKLKWAAAGMGALSCQSGCKSTSMQLSYYDSHYG